MKDLAGFANWSANLTGTGDAERLVGVRALPNTFQMLGVDAVVGRPLAPADGRAGNDRVVMLTFGLWQRRFGGDPKIVGQTLTLNGDSYNVVGVTPREFIFPGADPASPLDHSGLLSCDAPSPDSWTTVHGDG